MEKTSLIVSFIGDDRPGLVEQFSKTIAEQDANWVESRMTEMCGKFAGLFRVEANPDKLIELKKAIESLSSDTMNIMTEEISGEVDSSAVQYRKIEVVGHDQVGIVREVSRNLLEENINISDFHSEVYSAPMTGVQIFKAIVTFENIDEHDNDGLQAKLDKIAAALSLEIKLI